MQFISVPQQVPRYAVPRLHASDSAGLSVRPNNHDQSSGMTADHPCPVLAMPMNLPQQMRRQNGVTGLVSERGICSAMALVEKPGKGE